MKAFVIASCLVILASPMSPARAQENYSGVDCQTECTKRASSFCLKMTSEGGKLQKSFAKLSKRLQSMDEKTPITPGELQKIFDVKSDPCNRSQTTLSKSLLTNRGGECILTTSFPVAGSNTATVVEVLIPKDLTLTFSKAGDQLKFSPAKGLSGAIFFNLNDKSLHADWGGHVLGANLNDKYAILTTARGCIGMSLK